MFKLISYKKHKEELFQALRKEQHNTMREILSLIKALDNPIGTTYETPIWYTDDNGEDKKLGDEIHKALKKLRNKGDE